MLKFFAGAAPVVGDNGGKGKSAKGETPNLRDEIRGESVDVLVASTAPLLYSTDPYALYYSGRRALYWRGLQQVQLL